MGALHPRVRQAGQTDCVWLREPPGPLGKEELYLTVGALSTRIEGIALPWCAACHGSATGNQMWVGSRGVVNGVDFVGNVGLDLDRKERRIWVKSHRRAEGLSKVEL